MKQSVLTVAEVAAILKLSESTIYKYAEKGKIQSIKIGSNLRFTEEQIQQFLSLNTQITKSDLKA
jgi:PTS system nitrogen regulatory IIA component